MVRGNPSRLDGDGCAPGMVNWVLASHNRRRSLIRVTGPINPQRWEKLPCARTSFDLGAGKLKRKLLRRLEAWT
jgi:hypothetical protein